MKKLNVVPLPNRVEYIDGVFEGGEIKEEIISNVALGNEGYRLEIKRNEISVQANTAAGIFYAKQTLRQLERSGCLPCAVIEDTPRFAYRGFMVDSARHMQTVDELKKIIDGAALFKFNKFHWHLSDDQGFRIESDKFHLLNQKGSWRKCDDFGGLKSNERYGGYYTKAEIKEIVAYCSKRFIEVVPELDMPGHTTAMISAYPQLSCRKLQIPVQTKQGIFKDILCAGDDNTLSFIFELLEEIIPLFPGESFHIGGDEVPKARWDDCPKCRERQKTLGLKNSEELQGWFSSRVVEFLEARGKKAVVWNESLASGKLPAGVTVQRWMDGNRLSSVWANRGNSIINSDFYHYYCDYPYHMTPLEKTYSYSPIPKGVAPVMEKYVIGVEAPIWTEYIATFERLCYQIFPRFAAVAERGWTNEKLCDYESFEKRFGEISPMLGDMGITPAPKSHCNPSPVSRLAGTIGFFKDKIDFEAIKNINSGQL